MGIKCKGITEEEKMYILSHFSYSDGKLIRNDRAGSDGSLDKDGYLIIKVKGKQYKAHRLVWLVVYGEYPTEEIDHIDRNRLNNCIENLRLSNRKEQINNTTRTPNRDTGVVGVYLDKCTKGLKKKYTFKFNNRTYRSYTLEGALKKRNELQSNENSA